ncbi:hypothetical protein ACQP1W_24855 [Spirillospora sp. CA-255316]
MAGAPVWVSIALAIALITVIVAMVGVIAHVIVGNHHRRRRL